MLHQKLLTESPKAIIDMINCIQLFKVKLKQKYQTELYLARKNATLHNFNQKWLFNPLALKF